MVGRSSRRPSRQLSHMGSTEPRGGGADVEKERERETEGEEEMKSERNVFLGGVVRKEQRAKSQMLKKIIFGSVKFFIFFCFVCIIGNSYNLKKIIKTNNIIIIIKNNTNKKHKMKKE